MNTFPSIRRLSGINIFYDTVRFATKKAGGSTKNGRDSPGQRLGLKKSGGQPVIPGNIIIRQRGRKYHEGNGCGIGRDHTLYALVEGWVKFKYDPVRKRQSVHVVDKNPNIPADPNRAAKREKFFQERAARSDIIAAKKLSQKYKYMNINKLFQF